MHDDDQEHEQPSKTQRKKDMLELQSMGRALTETDTKLLEKLSLPEGLLDAILEYKRLPNKNEARRRQLQFIGRLMREVDTEEIRAFLDHSHQNAEAEKRRLHTLESTRDRLIEGDSELLEELIRSHPALDIQHLRQLIRQAQKEREANKPPAAGRKLFRYLRDVLGE